MHFITDHKTKKSSNALPQYHNSKTRTQINNNMPEFSRLKPLPNIPDFILDFIHYSSYNMAVVSSNRYKPSHQRLSTSRILYGIIVITLVVAMWQMLFIDDSSSLNHILEANLRSERVNYKKGKVSRPVITSAIFDESDWDAKNKFIAAMKRIVPNSCGYTGGLNDLKPEELHPVAGKRHMITPPKGGKLSLVCCDTTKGPLAALVHHSWAPLGAEHFMDMVTSQYFDSGVPMMRCMKDFLCQFGINSDPAVTKKFKSNIEDDPNWLPEGPKYRENSDGVKRFAKGYLAYAGGGKNSVSGIVYLIHTESRRVSNIRTFPLL